MQNQSNTLQTKIILQHGNQANHSNRVQKNFTTSYVDATEIPCTHDI